MISSTLTSKGQITIPKKIREMLKLKTSDRVIFVPLEDGKVLMTTETAPAESLFGMLKHRAPKKAVSLKVMDEAIARRRRERAGK